MITGHSRKLTARDPLDQERRLWLADLYESNHAAVFRLCAAILRDSEDAADASQEVFLTAVGSLNPTVASASATAWLLTVARNHCLDLLRRRKRFGKALVTLGSEPSALTDVETAVADRDFISEVFRHLSSRERQVLWQSVVEHRPLSDIAGRLRLSYMAAAQVAHRARLHASQIAARVAVTLGLLGLGRVRLGSMTGASRLAAAFAIPLMAVALHSSSSISPSVPPPVAGASSGGHVSVASGALRSGAPLPAAIGAPDVKDHLLPSVNGTSVGQLLGSLPGTIVPSPVVPSLPPVASPTAIPTLAPIPTPTGIP